jgi:subtilisin family serine protease
MKRLNALHHWTLAAVLLAGAVATAAAEEARPPRPARKDGELLIKLKRGVDPARAERSIRSRGAFELRRLKGARSLSVLDQWRRVTLPKGMELATALRRFASDPTVERAEPNYRISMAAIPNDPLFPQQWSLHNEGIVGPPGIDIGAPAAWDLTTGDPSTVVAVLDTGVDFTHPDLTASAWTNPGEIPGNGIDDDHNGYVDDVHGVNLVWRFSEPTDDNGHGTRIAGIIGAEGDNGIGIAGVSWHSQIMALKVLDATGTGWTGDAAEAILYAASMGARVLNNSWTTSGFSQVLEDAVRTANEADALVVTAAGNGSFIDNNGVVVAGPGIDIDAQPRYPASFELPNVLTVTASDPGDGMPPFANWGAASVDLAAPGVFILSTVPMAGAAYSDPSGYAWADGTSLAAAHVSGAAALLRARFPEITSQQIKDRLMGSVDRMTIPPFDARTVTGGRLNVFRALQDDDEPPAPASDLAVVNAATHAIALSWTATGDDGYVGRATRYELRYWLGAPPAPVTLRTFLTGTAVNGLPAPDDPGSPAGFVVSGLEEETPYSFVLAIVDDVGNMSLSPAVSAFTQSAQTAFGDSFESGIGGWAIEGSDGAGGPALWHLSSHRAGSPTHALYYGRESSLTYNTGHANFGSVTSPLIDLSGRTDAWLSFRHFLRTEGFAPYDAASVAVSSDGGSTWTRVYGTSLGTPGSALQDVGIDLSPFAGRLIRLRFAFDTLDSVANDFEGWVVDDVLVTASAVPDPSAPRKLWLTVAGLDRASGHFLADPPGGDCANIDDMVGAPVPEKTCVFSYPANTPINVLLGFLYPGATFSGWSGDCSGSEPLCPLLMSQHRVVRANLVGPQPLTLTVKSVDHAHGTVILSPLDGGPQNVCDNFDMSPSQRCTFSYAWNSIVNLWAIPTSYDTEFQGWSGACAGVTGPYCTVTMSEARSVTATFRGPLPLTLAVASTENGQGSVSAFSPDGPFLFCHNFGPDPPVCSGLFRAGTEFELQAMPAPDSIFAGWSGACTGMGPCHVTMTQAQEVTALFRGPQQLTLTAASTENGQGSLSAFSPEGPGLFCHNFGPDPPVCRALFRVGMEFELQAMPAPDSIFVGWSGACTGMGPCHVTMTQAQEVTALFRGPQLLTLSIVGVEGGGGNVAVTSSTSQVPPFSCDNLMTPNQTCTSLYPVDTLVDLVVNPSSISLFVGWSGACSGTGPCQVRMSQAQSVTATFRGPQDLALTVSGTEGAAGRVSAEPLDIAAIPGCDNFGTPALSCLLRYRAGTAVQLTASPAPDSVFAGWEGACAGTVPTCLVPMSEPRTIAARFRLANHPPVANPGGPYTGFRGQAVVFNGTGSTDGDGDPLSYRWDFGDGASGTGATPSHVFPGLGPFTVTLRVNDGHVDSAPATVGVSIVNRPPGASAGPDQIVELGTAVTLSGSGADPDGDDLAYEWRNETGAVVGTTPSLALMLPLGAHTFTLTVRDVPGATASDEVVVTVLDTQGPAIAVTAPSGAAIVRGVPFTIQWTASDNGALASFDAGVSFDGGATFTALPGCTGLPGTARSCLWASPGPAAASAQLKVSGQDASHNAGAGTSSFSIVNPTIVVTAPNTAVNWGIGSTQAITWTTTLATAATVKVELSRNGGGSWSVLNAAAPNTGRFDWTVTGPSTSGARVRVSWTDDPAVTDRSDVNFTIAGAAVQVTAPNSSVRWDIGSSHTIAWSHNLGTGASVRIEVSRDGGSSWSLIQAAVPNSGASTGTFSWTVTGPSTSRARIRVSWTANLAVNDRSDTNFTIR